MLPITKCHNFTVAKVVDDWEIEEVYSYEVKVVDDDEMDAVDN